MNYPEDTAQAADYLKQAIPHLVKHAIPANPINYTLWYNYVSKRVPALNRALNHIIKSSGTCTDKQSQELYFNYIIGEHLEEHQQTLKGITRLAAHIVQRLGKSTTGSKAFDQQLDRSIQSLRTAKSVEDVTEIIDDVISTSEDIRFANNVFRQQMKVATEEITSLRDQLQQAEKHAYVDQLTQLYNRHAFDRQLDQLLNTHNATNRVCLILTDIDHFKSFNDHYGHVIGDRVLKGIGKIIQEHCPINAIAARYGGEEFAIIISNSDQDEAASVAENLRLRVKKMRVRMKNSDKVLDNISASFGVARFEPGESTECFIDRADQALYRAKHNGRDRVEVHTQAVAIPDCSA